MKKNKVNRVEATLIEGSKEPEIRLMVPETVKKSTKDAPIAKVILENLNRLYNGRPTFLTFSLYEFGDNGRTWVKNISLKTTTKTKRKRFELVLTEFLEETKVYEAELFDDEGNEVNTYRFAFLLEDFVPPTEVSQEDPFLDPEFLELQRAFARNISIRSNLASVSLVGKEKIFLELKKRKKSKVPTSATITDDFGDLGQEPVNDDTNNDGFPDVIVGAQGPQGEDGLSLIPRGDFDPTEIYNVGNVVFNPFDNSSFAAIKVVPAGRPAPVAAFNDDPSQNEFWMLIIAGNAIVAAPPPPAPPPPAPPPPPLRRRPLPLRHLLDHLLK